MAKRNKKPRLEKKVNPQPKAGGYLYTQQAEQALINFLTKMPEMDEVLRKANISRHRLSVLMYDDEIYQCVEKRQDKLETTPFRLNPSDSYEAKIITAELKKWWSEITLAAQNARWFGYSVIEPKYDENCIYFDKDNLTQFIGWEWIGEKPMEWYSPKNDGKLMLLANYNATNKDIECDQNLKHFLTQCKPTFKNPLGEALFSRLYWLWFFKNGGFKYWAKFVERFGNPILVGKSKSIPEMLSALLNAHASSALSIHENESIEVLSASNNNAGSTAFESFDKKIERSIQKVILGQTLTSGTDGTGSRALGEVHLEVQDNKVKADIRMILPTIQAIINALCAINGWQSHELIIGEEKSLETPKADRDVKLKNAGANLTSQYFEREYSLLPGDLSDNVDNSQTRNFNSIQKRAFSFKADVNKLSPAQQEVEELTDTQPVLRLLDQKQVNQIIQQSDTPEALAFNLMQLIPEASQSEFTVNLERALYTADVLGYVSASEEK